MFTRVIQYSEDNINLGERKYLREFLRHREGQREEIFYEIKAESEVQVATCKIFMNAQTFISNLLNSPSINHTFPLQSPLYQINSNHRLDLKWKPRKSGNERSDSEKKTQKAKQEEKLRRIAQERNKSRKSFPRSCCARFAITIKVFSARRITTRRLYTLIVFLF